MNSLSFVKTVRLVARMPSERMAGLATIVLDIYLGILFGRGMIIRAPSHMDGSNNKDCRVMTNLGCRPKKMNGPLEMLRVTKLFYEDQLPRKTIAEDLQIDQRTVNRVLEDARKAGMVRIEIAGCIVPPSQRRCRARQLSIFFP
jgi:hypothetical protein